LLLQVRVAEGQDWLHAGQQTSPPLLSVPQGQRWQGRARCGCSASGKVVAPSLPSPGAAEGWSRGHPAPYGLEPRDGHPRVLAQLCTTHHPQLLTSAQPQPAFAKGTQACLLGRDTLLSQLVWSMVN